MQQAASSGAEEQPDWPARTTAWLQEIEALFAKVEGWLAEAISKEIASSERSKEIVTGDCIGAYEAPVLTIAVGHKRIRFTPKRTLIIAAHGRVDVA